MINIKNLIDDEKCYETVRQIRWPQGTQCAHCGSSQVAKRGRDDTQKFGMVQKGLVLGSRSRDETYQQMV